MNVPPLEAHLLAWFLGHGAREINFVARWWPHTEFVAMLADKIGISARQFGPKVVAAKARVAEELVALLQEKGGLLIKTDKFGGVMAQFQNEVYQELVAELTAADTVLEAAGGQGEAFWADAFGKLV